VKRSAPGRRLQQPHRLRRDSHQVVPHRHAEQRAVAQVELAGEQAAEEGPADHRPSEVQDPEHGRDHGHRLVPHPPVVDQHVLDGPEELERVALRDDVVVDRLPIRRDQELEREGIDTEARFVSIRFA